jgi:protease-4
MFLLSTDCLKIKDAPILASVRKKVNKNLTIFSDSPFRKRSHCIRLNALNKENPMADERESLLRTSLRSALKGLFWIFGFGIGLVLLIAMLKGVSSQSSLTQTSSVTVLPNASGERKALGLSGPVVLQLNIHGVIGVDGLTTSKIRTLLMESREGDLVGDRVKAVLLSIRSPGGTVADSDGIYHAILDYKQRYRVPVVAFVDGVAASGGFLIASAADRIVANDVSLIGSVGVISPPFFNVKDATEKLGIESLTIFAGKDKDVLNPFRTWKPDEGASLHEIVNSYYMLFVDTVTADRPKLNREKLINEYGAQVFVANEALANGFIDGVGYGPLDALKLLLEDAQLTGSDYRVVQLSTSRWLSELFDAQSPLLTGRLQHQLLLGPELDARLMGQFLYLFRL